MLLFRIVTRIIWFKRHETLLGIPIWKEFTSFVQLIYIGFWNKFIFESEHACFVYETRYDWAAAVEKLTVSDSMVATCESHVTWSTTLRHVDLARFSISESVNTQANLQLRPWTSRDLVAAWNCIDRDQLSSKSRFRCQNGGLAGTRGRGKLCRFYCELFRFLKLLNSPDGKLFQVNTVYLPERNAWTLPDCNCYTVNNRLRQNCDYRFKYLLSCDFITINVYP